MPFATSAHLDVTIKQEPRDDLAQVQAPVFHTPWLFAPAPLNLQAPFVDLAFADDGQLDAEMAAWSARHPDEPSMLDALLCHEEPTASPPPRMTSPVATSDVLRFHGLGRIPDPDIALAKPVSPSWCAARLQDTLAEEPPTCSIHGCSQPADRAGRCKRHAGGRLCQVPGCTKNTQSHGLCIRHGGGRRCEVEGCPRGAQARGKCKTHGGGVRCKAPGCERSSQGSGLCRTHGGGKLCDFPGCKKGTQRHGKCSTHGGARRCRVAGCEKVDRGGGLCGRHKAASSSHDDGSDVDAEPVGKEAIV